MRGNKARWLVAALGLLWLALLPPVAFGDESLWTQHVDAAVEAYENGNYGEAEPLYERAIRMLEETFGPKWEDMIPYAVSLIVLIIVILKY